MKKLISILSAFLLCAFAYGANVYTNSFVRDGVTYVQRGVLTAKDYVVTNVVGGGGGGAVNSVNGKTGDVVLNAQDVGARPDNWNPEFIGDSYIKLWIEKTFPNPDKSRPVFSIGNLNNRYLAFESDLIKATNSLPNWTKSPTKPTYTAEEVGALPVDGTAEHAIFADEAGVIQWPNIQTKPWWAESDDYALIANEANYSTEAGHVPWNGIEEKPDWIGNTKPTYTPQEIGAAPSKIKMDIIKVYGIDSEHYEIQLNGVRQTYQQIYDYATTREVSIARSNALYKPTYIGQNEMMFDCTGTIQNEAASRMIHIFRTPETVQLTDTKYLADKDWVLGLSTTYTNLAGSAFVSLNQSVQTVTVDGAPVTISMPTAVQGGTRDFVVYVNNTSAATDAPLVLPAGTYYADDDTATNAFTKGTVSALYITEMDGAFMIGRKELKQIVVQ